MDNPFDIHDPQASGAATLESFDPKTDFEPSPSEAFDPKTDFEADAPSSGFFPSLAASTASGLGNAAASLVDQRQETSDQYRSRMQGLIDGQQAGLDATDAAATQRGFSTASDDFYRSQAQQELEKNKGLLDINTKAGGPYDPAKDADKSAFNARSQARAGAISDFSNQDVYDFYGANPKSTNPAAQIGRGIGTVASVAPTMVLGGLGLPAAVVQMTGSAFEQARSAKVQEMTAAGETDQDAINTAADAAGKAASDKAMPGLALYFAGGALASKVASGLMGEGASVMAKTLAGFTGATVSNVGSSAVLRALDAPAGQRLEAAIPKLENLTADTLFGVIHGVGSYSEASETAKAAAGAELARRGFSQQQIEQPPAPVQSADTPAAEVKPPAATSAPAEPATLDALAPEPLPPATPQGEVIRHTAEVAEANEAPLTAEALRQKATATDQQAAPPQPAAPPPVDESHRDTEDLLAGLESEPPPEAASESPAQPTQQEAEPIAAEPTAVTPAPSEPVAETPETQVTKSYAKLKASSGEFSDVRIRDIQQDTGMPMDQLHQVLRKMAASRQIELLGADLSRNIPGQKESSIKLEVNSPNSHGLHDRIRIKSAPEEEEDFTPTAKPTPKSFGQRIQEIADAQPESNRFGTSKVYLHPVFEQALKEGLVTDRADFNAKMEKAARTMEVGLARADFPPHQFIKDPVEKARIKALHDQSETPFGGSANESVHFMRPRDILSSKTQQTEEGALVSRLREAERKAPSEADLTGPPKTLEFQKPGSAAKISVQNTKEALRSLADRYLPKGENRHAEFVAEGRELEKRSGGLRVVVHRNEFETPELNLERGVTHEGVLDTRSRTVHLFSDNIKDVDRLREVFAHEAVGHYGVQAVLPYDRSEWQGIADQVFKTAPSAVLKISKDYVKDERGLPKHPRDFTPEDRAKIASEYVARLAERPGSNPGVWKAVVQAIRNGLRSLGIVREWSDEDIRDLIRRGGKALNRGEVVAGRAMPAAIKDLPDDVHELSPNAEKIEASFERSVPDPNSRDRIDRYVSARLAGGEEPTITAREKSVGDRFVAYFTNKQAFAEKNGVLDAAREAYNARTANLPRLALTDRLALYDAEVNRIVAERATGGVQPPTAAASTGEGGPIPRTSGVAHRIGELRGTEAERGAGVGSETAVDRGRRHLAELIASGGKPEDVMDEFDRTGALTERSFGIGRAQQEVLDRATHRAVDEYGAGSPEDDVAREAERDWRARFKKMSTEWSNLGRAQQGETDIDTGSFTGIRRAWDEVSTRDFTPDQAKTAQRLADRVKAQDIEIAAANAKLAEMIDQQQAKATEAETSSYFAKLLSDLKGGVKDAKKGKKSFGEVLAEQGAAARARMAGRQKMMAGIDLNPADLVDRAISGAEIIFKGAKTLADFTTKLVEQFGNEIREHAPRIYQASKDYLAALRKAHGKAEPKEEMTSAGAVEAAKARSEAGTGLDHRTVANLARAFANEGVGARGGREGSAENMTAVHESLLPHFPGVTMRDVQELFTEYGKATFPSEDPIAKQLAESRVLERLKIQLENAQRGEASAKSGPQRAKATEAVRTLQREVNETARRMGVKVADPAKQLATSLEAAKSSARNRIEELNSAIASGRRMVNGKSEIIPDAELTELRRTRDERQKVYDAAFPKVPITDAERAARAEKVLDATIAGEDQRLREGRYGPEPKAGEVTNPALEHKRAMLAAMRDTRRQLHEASLPAPLPAFHGYKSGDPMSNAQLKDLWSRARAYMAAGNGVADTAYKVATDLGIKATDVLKGLNQSRAVKRAADDVWMAQRQSRTLKAAAKRWIDESQQTWLSKLVPKAARGAFALKTGAHGLVALGTHAAPVLAEHPIIFARNFGKMYKMVFSPEAYELEMAALKRDPNYTVAQRAGLVNDPGKMEDFNDPELQRGFPALADFFRRKLKKIGADRLVGMGTRGYAVLKPLRQDLFNLEWNKMADIEKTPEMAAALADSFNHITGVVKTGIDPGWSLGFFAPKLWISRAAVMVGDPARAISSALKMSNMTPEERWFARNQLRSKAKIFAVASSVLGANQLLNNMLGDKKKINSPLGLAGIGQYDPMASDFMKLRVAGLTFAWGSPFISLLRLPLRLLQIGKGDGGKLAHVVYPEETMANAVFEYARTQASPLLGPLITLVTKADYENRPLPQIPGYGVPPPMPKRLAAQGVKPYTWTEFASRTMLPIPAEEAAKEVFHHGLGLSQAQQKAYLQAFVTVALMSATGGRVSEDTQPDEQPPAKK